MIIDMLLAGHPNEGGVTGQLGQDGVDGVDGVDGSCGAGTHIVWPICSDVGST